IWWDDQAILAEETAWHGRAEKDGTTARRTRLLLIAGEYENEGSIAQDSAALAARLAPLSGAGLRSQHLLLHGETHVTVPHSAVTATTRAGAGWPRLPGR